ASVRSNRRMSAIVAISFQDSLASGLAQDKGAVAFYAGSKSKFCPVLRYKPLLFIYALLIRLA
ncbi:MAG TPA: hypothetical protein VLJ61_11140, partial [Pyrinomonadaceae bacterium]|nr:hypothetical protein [Pyrinomonadaceae bacterium]